MTIIFITHELSIAYVMPKEVMVIYAGRVMQFNVSEKIVKDSKHSYHNC